MVLVLDEIISIYNKRVEKKTERKKADMVV